jgi:phosphoglucomutase
LDYLKEYDNWIKNVNEDAKKHLEKISKNNDEIIESFSKHLEFGTAGIRGIIGYGPNRINIYVVGQTVQALANILNKSNKTSNVIIAFDSRNKSIEFAKHAAKVLAANGIKVYLFNEIQPVPVLSFGIRYLKTSFGIVITASHNPSKYNGCKIYGSDGAQIGLEDADLIFEEIKKINIFEEIKNIDFENAKNQGLIEIVGEEIERAYLDAIKTQQINKTLTKKYGENIKIVYTPFHGSGNKLVRKILYETGFKNVMVVAEQELPDGNFPTVKCPNPEYLENFELAIKLAKEKKTELVIGTDPDSDRIGVVILNKNENYILLTGNQVGILLTEYILSQGKKNECLPDNAFIAKTIVTTNMIKKIANFYNVKMYETLTGFKFIGELIKKSEKEQNEKFIFGFEESYGYLAGTHSRDKDAIVASMLISEMVLYYKNKNLNLIEQLDKLYNKYGFYVENTISITLEGIHGLEKIENIIKKLRKNYPENIGKKICVVRDYLFSTQFDLIKNKETKINLPKSNVLYFELENDCSFIVRPSGTEPKIKFYLLANGKTKKEANETIEILKKFVKNIKEKELENN